MCVTSRAVRFRSCVKSVPCLLSLSLHRPSITTWCWQLELCCDWVMGEEKEYSNYSCLQISGWLECVAAELVPNRQNSVWSLSVVILVYLYLNCVETVEVEFVSFVSLITVKTETWSKEKWVLTSVAHCKFFFWSLVSWVIAVRFFVCYFGLAPFWSEYPFGP